MKNFWGFLKADAQFYELRGEERPIPVTLCVLKEDFSSGTNSYSVIQVDQAVIDKIFRQIRDRPRFSSKIIEDNRVKS